MMQNIQKRDIGLAVVLSIITCGIYGLYWLYCLAEDINAVSGENETSGGMVVVLSIITCSIYTIYWAYKSGEKLNAAKAQKGIQADSNLPVIYLILCLFGLGIITYALMQSDLNKIAE